MRSIIHFRMHSHNSDEDYYGAGPSLVKTYDVTKIAKYPVPPRTLYPDKARQAMDQVILSAASLSRSNPRRQADAEAKKTLLVGLHPDSQVYDTMPAGSRDPWNTAIWTARLSILLKAADYQFSRRSCSMDSTQEFYKLPPLINMTEYSELLGIDDFLRGTLKGVGITHMVNPCTPVPCLCYYRFVGARAASLWDTMAGKISLDSVLWKIVGPFGQKTVVSSQMSFPHILEWQDCLIKQFTWAFNFGLTRLSRKQTQEHCWSSGLTKRPNKTGIGTLATGSKVAASLDSRRVLECPSC